MKYPNLPKRDVKADSKAMERLAAWVDGCAHHKLARRRYVEIRCEKEPDFPDMPKYANWRVKWTVALIEAHGDVDYFDKEGEGGTLHEAIAKALSAKREHRHYP